MVIRLKTHNFRIAKIMLGGYEYEIIKLRLNIPPPPDNIIAKLTYVLKNNYMSIPKDRPLTWWYTQRQNGIELSIPIDDNSRI